MERHIKCGGGAASRSRRGPKGSLPFGIAIIQKQGSCQIIKRQQIAEKPSNFKPTVPLNSLFGLKIQNAAAEKSAKTPRSAHFVQSGEFTCLRRSKNLVCPRYRASAPLLIWVSCVGRAEPCCICSAACYVPACVLVQSKSQNCRNHVHSFHRQS